MRVGWLSALLLFGSIEALALTLAEQHQIVDEQKAKERAKAIQDAQPAAPTVNLQETNITTPKKLTITKNEIPCFEIKSVELTGEDAVVFKSSMSCALKSIGFKPGECIGTNSINAILSTVGNEIIRNGYVTTRVVADPQDLKSGKLELTVIPGKVNNIRFEQTPKVDTNAKRANSFNAMPVKKRRYIESS